MDRRWVRVECWHSFGHFLWTMVGENFLGGKRMVAAEKLEVDLQWMLRNYERSWMSMPGTWALGKSTLWWLRVGSPKNSQNNPGKEKSFKYLPGPQTAEFRTPQISHSPYFCLLLSALTLGKSEALVRKGEVYWGRTKVANCTFFPGLTAHFLLKKALDEEE